MGGQWIEKDNLMSALMSAKKVRNMSEVFTVNLSPEWDSMSDTEYGQAMIDYVKNWFGVDDVWDDLEKEQADEIQEWCYEHDEDEAYGRAYFHLIHLYDEIMIEQGYDV